MAREQEKLSSTWWMNWHPSRRLLIRKRKIKNKRVIKKRRLRWNRTVFFDFTHFLSFPSVQTPSHIRRFHSLRNGSRG